MEKRAPVYTAIDSERNFQDDKWGADKRHDVGSWILLLEEAALKARQAWYNAKGDQEALSRIRVVASIAVACMEHHGAPLREQTEPITQITK